MGMGQEAVPGQQSSVSEEAMGGRLCSAPLKTEQPHRGPQGERLLHAGARQGTVYGASETAQGTRSTRSWGSTRVPSDTVAIALCGALLEFVAIAPSPFSWMLCVQREKGGNVLLCVEAQGQGRHWHLTWS